MEVGKTTTGTLEVEWEEEVLAIHLKEQGKEKGKICLDHRPFYLIDALQEAVDSQGAHVVWGKEDGIEVGAGFVIAFQYVEVLFKRVSPPYLYVVVQDDRNKWTSLIKEFTKLPVL